MSAGNFQFERKRNYELQKKTVNADYTIKTGTATYNGLIDNPVEVDDPSDDIAITLPDGAYPGQSVFVEVVSNADTKDATLTVSTCTESGEDVVTLEDAGEYIWYMWTGTAWDLQNYHGCSIA